MPYYLYWARDAADVTLHFMSDRFFDIGSTILYEGRLVVVYDYAVEYDMSVFE